MLKYCLQKWNDNKDLLEQRIRNDPDMNSCDYVDLVRLVVDYVLNPYEYDRWDSENITVIDNGDYQGTQLYLIPRETYQPAEYEYLMTYCGYGSCSGCDTLLAIRGWDDEPLTERQVKDYMTLCRHLLMNMVKPYNGGWRSEEDFVEVTFNKE